MRINPATFLRNALAWSIVVVTIGLLGFGIRTFATAGETHLSFAVVCVISIAILVLYFMLSRRTRRLPANSPFPKPPFKYHGATTGPKLKPLPEAVTVDPASRKLAA